MHELALSIERLGSAMRLRLMMNVVKITPAFSDARGEIIDVLKNSVVEYATLITSKGGRSARQSIFTKRRFNTYICWRAACVLSDKCPGSRAKRWYWKKAI